MQDQIQDQNKAPNDLEEVYQEHINADDGQVKDEAKVPARPRRHHSTIPTLRNDVYDQ